MRDPVAEWAPALLDDALDLIGADLFDRVDEGTRYLQPALYCASIAGWERLRAFGLGDSVRAFAGHSLGELGALVGAGALDPHEGLRLVALRGELMDRAAHEGPPGGMVAVIGRDRALLDSVAGRLGLTIANDNGPEQVVLSGPSDALEEAAGELRGQRMRVVPLAVPGAFHCTAMEPIVAEFEAALERADWRAPQAPVWSSVTCAPFEGDFAALLAAALTNPVRWRELLQGLAREGIEQFVEVGPGRVLARLVRRNLDGVTAVAAEDLLAHA
jgi:malonyl CoA-acyl carrier protein transacylase